MGDEKKDDGEGYPFKMLLEEALVQQRNEIMDNFTTPFKVQVNFDIPLFEELIYVGVVDKWCNLIEGYFLVHNFFDSEILLFHSSKSCPMLRTHGTLNMIKGP
jgi:hypothetical protein